jgi:mRNA interferase RelE/StbE
VKRYAIHYVRPARKDLEALPAEIQDRILAAIDSLQDDPRPRGCKKLRGSDDEYRIRVGQYRVIYEIHEKTVVILIVRISHRKDAYR